MAEPVSPLLRWLCEEQADIHGTELAELSGIARQTWSKVRQGKQDLSSDLLWRWSRTGGTPGTTTCSFTLQIATDAAGSNIVATGTGTAIAFVDIP